MSKSISIKEGNENKQFTAKKLQTNLQNGGTCFWVPEDETKLITKRVNAPGEYVAANEEVEQGQDPIYGYDKVIVSGVKPDTDTKLISKSITENGTYKVADEPVDTSGKKPYGYSTVHVNVKGGGKYTDPDTGEVVRPDPSSDPGSTIVGTNPDTGNEEARTVDDNGQLKTLELASYIQLDTPPTKMEYKDGERIMMGGAVAHGYKKDGTPYKGTLAASELPWHQYGDGESSEYSEDFLPGGIVFEMPLYADISKAEGGSGKSAISELVPVELPISGEYRFVIKSTTTMWMANVGIKGENVTCFRNDTTSYILLASAEPFTKDDYQKIALDQGYSGGEWYERYYYYTEDVPDTRSYTRNNKKVYYIFVSNNRWTLPDAPYWENADVDYAAWTIIYGTITDGGKQTITLTWPREGDRKHLQTTFDITVTE